MKRFLIVLLCMPTIARGEGDIEQNIFAGVYDLAEFVNQELQIMEEKMKEFNPRLVESVANDSDIVKIIKYNNWMAEHIFEEYRDFFLWDLRQQSEKTGRKILSRYEPGVSYPGKYWLDEGIMETDQCNGGRYFPKEDSCIELYKSAQDEREHTCLYPDGFEEYSIYIDDNESMADSENNYLVKKPAGSSGVLKELKVLQDNAKENIRVKYEVELSGNSSIGENGANTSLLLQIFRTNMFYTDYHDWRNRVQQDIIDGKYTDGTVCEELPKETCDQYHLFHIPEGCASMGSGPDWKKWKSNRNIPMGRVYGENFDYLLYVTK